MRGTHRLADLDPEARRATCSTCGPVPIRRSGTTPGGKTQWRCRTTANQHKRTAGDTRAYRRHVGGSCERCGFEAEDPRLLDVHHRNGDHADNRPENLATLCPICHRRHHLGI